RRSFLRKVPHKPLGLDHLNAFEIGSDWVTGELGLRNVTDNRFTNRARANDFNAYLGMARKRLLIDGLAARSVALHRRVARSAQLHKLVQHFIFEGPVEDDDGLPQTCKRHS